MCVQTELGESVRLSWEVCGPPLTSSLPSLTTTVDGGRESANENRFHELNDRGLWHSWKADRARPEEKK